MAEEQTLSIAAGNAAVSGGGLPRAVDGTAHDRHGDGLGPPPRRRFSTSWARGIRLIRVRPQVGQEISSGPSFRRPQAFKILRATTISSTGSAVSVTRKVSPIPKGQQTADANGRLDGAHLMGARLGDPQVKWVIAALMHHQR